MNARKKIDAKFEAKKAFREGDYVRLLPNKKEGWPEEFGTVEGVEKDGMMVVRLDDAYLTDDDDGLRELDSTDGGVEHATKVKAKLGPVTDWQSAQKAIPASRPASDAVMKSIKTEDGRLVFGKENGQWYAASDTNPTARVGYDLAAGFHAENGGGVTWRDVAMFTLAADADGAHVLPERITTLLTAGFEDRSAQAKKQRLLQKQYPNITAVIHSFFR